MKDPALPVTSFPMFPLGELNDYPEEILKELADQHLERALEVRGKLEEILERYEEIVTAMRRKEAALRMTA